MAVGDTYPDERVSITDPGTGRAYVRLTATSRNKLPYLYVDAFDRQGRLVYVSERDGHLNFYRMDLDSGIGTQLTAETEIAAAGLAWHSPAPGLLVYWAGRKIRCVDLQTLEARTVSDYPRYGGYLTLTADAQHVVTYYDLGDEKDMMGRNRVGPWALFSLPLDGSGTTDPSGEKVLETPFLVNHIQASPTDPDCIEYCWEWNTETTIPQRMWFTDLSGAAGGPFGRQAPNSFRVHEFWYRDGSHMGYHGRRRAGADPEAPLEHVIGTVSSDGHNAWELPLEANCGHCMYHTGKDLWVTDRAGEYNGLAFIRIHEHEGLSIGRYERLCLHNSTWKTQGCHPHPQFSPDGDRLVWTSDGEGVSQVYMMEVPRR